MSAWQEFLCTQNPSEALLDSPEQKVSLDAYSLIRVSGQDALNFLQNQFSNDVRKVNAEKGQINSWSSAKGRMFSVFRLFYWQGAYYLLLPASVATFVQQRLQMFVLRSKVTIENCDEDLTRIIWIGKERPSFEGLPLEPYDCKNVNGTLCVRLEGPEFRYLFIGTTDSIIEVWKQIEGNPASLNRFRLSEIDAAVPTIWPQTQESFVLQMANLEVLGGVSFNKGCYPGQEVVARMHYLGKLKRRMYMAEIASNVTPEPGAEIVKKGASTRDGCGQVVDAIAINSERVRLLYVAQIERADADEIRLLQQPEIAIERKELPYNLIVNDEKSVN